LSANLSANGPLSHGRLSDGLTILEDESFAARATNDESAFADVWKHGIPSRIVYHALNSGIGVLEVCKGFLACTPQVLGGLSGESSEREAHNECNRDFINFIFHTFLLPV
jgi:hypothetical protein